MPAVERQLAFVARNALKRDKLGQVGLVLKNDTTEARDDFMEALGTSAAVTVSSSAKDLSNLDLLVVDRVLLEANNNRELLETFTRDALNSLNLGGVAIIREDLESLNDPKRVAKWTDYFDSFRNENDGKITGFEFYAVNSVEESIYLRQNWNDFFWTLIKKEFPAQELETPREHMDQAHYGDTEIHAYEYIFEDNFISPGGYQENLSILKRFGNIRASEKMLDIGIGVGGGVRAAAYEFGLHVHGIELSANMFAVALSRQQIVKDTRVTYTMADVLVYDLPESSYDYVYSRDCIMHIHDTAKLFRRIYAALKPGGKVLITTYGVGYGAQGEKFKAFVARRQYNLKNLKQIAELAHTSGFVNVHTEDISPRFKEIMGEERSRVENSKEDFLSKFSPKMYDALVNGWSDKIQYIDDDNLTWILFSAEKPC